MAPAAPRQAQRFKWPKWLICIHGSRCIYLYTWMVDFYGIHVGEYTSSHGSVMGLAWISGSWFQGFLLEFWPRSLRRWSNLGWDHHLAWVIFLVSPDTNIMWIMSLCIRDLCIAVNPPFPPRIGWLLSSWKRSGCGLFGSLIVLGATNLGGGFKYVLCSPLFGEMIQTNMLQMGWNHQPEIVSLLSTNYEFV